MVKNKIIRENDTYFLETLGNKIIINDNYSGVLIFDFEMNFIEGINILENIVIYNSYVISNNELILFCPENEKMIYIDVEKNISKVININKKLSNIIELRLLCRKNKICIFVSSHIFI